MAKSFNVDILLNVLNKAPDAVFDLQTELEDLFANARRGTAAFQMLDRALGRLGKQVGGASALEEIYILLDDISKGIVDVNNTKLALNAEEVQQQLKAIYNTLQSIVRLSDNLDDIQLFSQASEVLGIVKQLDTELKKQLKTNEDITQEISKQTGLIDSQVSKTIKSIGNIEREFNKLKNIGEVVPRQAGLVSDVRDAIAELENLREEKAKLGKDTVSIDIRIANARKLLNDIEDISDVADRIAKRDYELKLEAGQSIKKLTDELKGLQKELAKAIETKDINIIADLNVKTDKAEAKLASLTAEARATGATDLLPNLAKARASFGEFRKELTGAESNIPKGIIGYFTRLKDGVGNARKTLLSSNNAIRTTAGGLRLLGTSAFLVGGQFRTLGFGASAFGNLLQTFGPLIAQITGSLGPLAPLVLAVGAALAAVTVQAAAFTVALVSIIDTGFTFNNQFAKVQNSVAAVAREFFSFSSQFRPIPESLSEGAKSALEFELAGAEVAKQLEALQFEATQTEFTAQDLFEAFQSTTSALGNLSPSLEDSRKLTGLFARTASIARVPISQLGSSISQIVAGTGRVTNPLVRDVFNKLKDSEGVALTAKRIRELRAQGGTVLFDELTAALKRFTDGVGELQAERTLSGAASNIQDLFQVFSGRATKEAFTSVIASFVRVRNAIVNVDKATGEINFTPPFQKLLNVASAFITRIGEDISALVDKLVGWFETLGQYIEDNYQEFVAIYEIGKDILSIIGDIIKDFLEIVGLSESAGTSLSVIKTVLVAIAGALSFVRLTFNLTALAVLAVQGAVVGIAGGLGAIVKYLTGNTVLEDWAISAGNSITKNVEERLASLKDTVQNFAGTVKSGISSEQFRADLTKKAPKVVEDVTSTPIGGQPTSEEGKRESQRSRLQLAEEYKQFYNTLLDISQESNNLLLQQAQDRIQKEIDLVNAQVNLGLRSQTSAQKAIDDLKITGIKNEILIREQAIEAIKRKEAAAVEATRRAREILKAQRGSEQEQADATNNADKKGIELATERIKSEFEKVKLSNEIRNLKYQELQIELESLQVRTQETLDLRKESAALSATIANLQYPDSFISLTEKFKVDILSASERYTKLSQEISNIQESLKVKTDPGELKRLEYLQQVQKLLITELALNQQKATFDQAQAVAGRELETLNREQLRIQREVDFGRISAEEGVRRITRINYEYSRALQAVLTKLKQISGENPTLEQQNQIFELEQRLQSLSDALTENTLINASNSLRDSLVDTFVSVQENAGGAVDAVKSFAQSVLSTFRRLLAEKIVRDFFSTLFPETGQTAGPATGLFARFFRFFGLDPATAAQQQVNNAPANPELQRRIEAQLQTGTFGTLSDRERAIQSQLEKAREELVKTLEPVTAKLAQLATAAAEVPQALDPTKLTSTFDTILSKFQTEFLDKTIDVFKYVKTELQKYIDSALKGTPVDTTGNASSPSAASQAIGGISTGQTSVGTSGSRRIGTGVSSVSKGAVSGTKPKAAASGAPSSSNEVPPGNIAPLNIGGGKQPVTAATGYINPFGAPVGSSAFATTAISAFGATKGTPADLNRTQLINNIRKGSAALQKLIPDSAFNQIPTEQLPFFDFLDQFNQFKNALDSRLSEEYGAYNILPRGKQNTALLDAVGYIIGKSGTYEPTNIPVIRKITANDILAKSGNNVITAGNIASQIISDINTATRLSQEIIAKSANLKQQESDLQTQQDLLNQGQYQGQENAIKGSLSARQQLINNLKKEISDKTYSIQTITKNLSALLYTGNTSNLEINESTRIPAFRPARTAPTMQSTQRFAKGGAVFGEGGPTTDSIPAMLSNGEYVVNAKSVKKLGVPFFNRLNNINKYADGGRLIDALYSNSSYTAPSIDTGKFNYFGGAASLIRNAAPIVEAAAAVAQPQRRKKRGIFGSILSGIAPFLNFIPGIGPLLALGAGAAGGALSGSEQGIAKGILGGIFGGVSNLGVFKGSKGFLGSLSRFFGDSGKGAPILNLLGFSGAGNIGNTIGQGLFGITNQLFPPVTKNLVPKTIVRDLIAKGVSGKFGSYNPQNIGALLRARIGGPKIGAFRFADGGLVNLALMLGSMFLPSLLNKTPKSPDYSITDPDAARKNRFGSAYNALVDYGLIGEYKYTKETLDSLRRGSKWTPIQRQKSSIGGVLGSILPMVFGAVSSYIKPRVKKAGGGMVTGSGTGTSDSIPAWLSSGEYVIKASAVRSLGTDILDSINEGRFKFAKGGIAGQGVSTLPEIDLANQFSSENPINVTNNTKVVNVLDPNLLGDYLQTNEGTKLLVNVISRRSKEIKSIINR